MFQLIDSITTRIKQENPLVLNITNQVTMDFIANGLLSLGASPIMSLSVQEASDLVSLADSVVINSGTLNDEFISLMHAFCKEANTHDKPIIFDPVGAGASHYRTTTCQHILKEYNIAILRGNASEIKALAGASEKTRGVDSTIDTSDAIDSARFLSIEHNVAILMSGSTDILIDKELIAFFDCGSPMMPLITGSGCLLSAVIGAFHAVTPNRFDAAGAATLFYGTCGERAALDSSTPTMFKMAFLNHLYTHPSESHYD
jgi:hydroxyethylthiazole kinase